MLERPTDNVTFYGITVFQTDRKPKSPWHGFDLEGNEHVQNDPIKCIASIDESNMIIRMSEACQATQMA